MRWAGAYLVRKPQCIWFAVYTQKHHWCFQFKIDMARWPWRMLVAMATELVDVTMWENVLLIHGSKFGQIRYVVMHASLLPAELPDRNGFKGDVRLVILHFMWINAGLTPIEVAANQNNVQMKMLLEGCCVWKGTLAFKVPRVFGDKTKDRLGLQNKSPSWSSINVDV